MIYRLLTIFFLFVAGSIQLKAQENEPTSSLGSLEPILGFRVSPLWLNINPPKDVADRSFAFQLQRLSAAFTYQPLLGNRHEFEVRNILFSNAFKGESNAQIGLGYQYDGYIKRSKFFKRKFQPYYVLFAHIDYQNNKFFELITDSSNAGVRTYLAKFYANNIRVKTGFGLGFLYQIRPRLNAEVTLTLKAYEFDYYTDNNRQNRALGITNFRAGGFDGTDNYLRIGLSYTLPPKN